MRTTVLGLTGGVGMGKSTAAQLLSARDVPVIDTDMVARQIVEPGQPALEDIREQFVPELIGNDGRLRREKLAQIVFADPDARRRLEAILHPRIRAVWTSEVDRWRGENLERGVVVIPLLFETRAEGQFDATICVACSRATQRERLRPRRWTEEQTQQRIQAQLPLEKKMALATFVAWSEGELTVLGQQLDMILASVRHAL
jgi:dephospho-CoA kinase